MPIEMRTKIPLGTLEVGDRIGRGGFGEVYRARVAPLQHEFAVKFLDPSPFNSAEGRAKERFIQEAEILIKLRHPYITPIYGIGESDGRPYILMEYFPGFNLQAVREKFGQPNPTQVLPFIEYVGSALEHAHSKGVIHRDIKPTNLMTIKSDARVVDFGIAYVMDPARESRLTIGGGTPVGDVFAAPELLANPRANDPRCDIYSLGACWYWLLTGLAPHGREWESPLRQFEGVSPPYESVLLKMLNPANTRYQTMQDVVRDVRALQSGVSPPLASADDLDDEAALLLGAIYEQWGPDRSPVANGAIQQSTASALTRVGFSIARDTLQERGLISQVDLENDYGVFFCALEITDLGKVWVKKNRTRVEALVGKMREESVDDDIPF